MQGVIDMNKYIEMKKRHQEEVNNFPKFFAFTEKRFNEQMIERGLDPEKDLGKILSINGGGFILRSDEEKFDEMFARHRKELSDAIYANENDFVVEMFRYELANHEYCITGNISDTLNAVGLSSEDINNNAALRKVLQKLFHSIWLSVIYEVTL